MIKTTIILLLLACFAINSKGQPISNDTVVCFIDTTLNYVNYRKNPHERDPSCLWQVSIKGHYYDISLPHHKDFSSIVFNANDLSNVHGPNFKGPFRLKVPKNELKTRYILVTDEWINQQTNFSALFKKIGSTPFSKYNYIIFKQEYDNSKNDSVTMHRVVLGYSEVEE